MIYGEREYCVGETNWYSLNKTPWSNKCDFGNPLFKRFFSNAFTILDQMWGSGVNDEQLAKIWVCDANNLDVIRMMMMKIQKGMLRAEDVVIMVGTCWEWWGCGENDDGDVMRMMVVWWELVWWCNENDGDVMKMMMMMRWEWWECGENDGDLMRIMKMRWEW